MKVKPLQIHWHEMQPIFSVDLDPQGGRDRLATAGGDNTVRIWRIVRTGEENDADIRIEYRSTLNRHAAAVNVVRFSPEGEILASAGDDGSIILWTQADASSKNSLLESGDADIEHETWKIVSILRGSLADIYDLAWSPCGDYIISGSIDNTARIWDVKQAKCIHVIADHHHYIQGVAWDPLGKYVATQSSDRSVGIYEYTTSPNGSLSFRSVSKSTKLEQMRPPSSNEAKPAEAKVQPPANDTPLPPVIGTESSGTEQTPPPAADTLPSSAPKPRPHKSTQRIYYDENLMSFFRRLAFTPDGAFLLTPAGHYREPSDLRGEEDLRNTVYIYPRSGLHRQPIAHLPGHRRPSIAVRCNPVRFKLREECGAWCELPYRMVYAVATQDAVFVYDTQQQGALAMIGNLHYATITDVAWSRDGRILLLCSTDGFCSVVSFDSGELGEPYGPPQTQAQAPQRLQAQGQGGFPSTPVSGGEPRMNHGDVGRACKQISGKEGVAASGKRRRIQPTFLAPL
ncbi:uncharacterized protein VTP21DRAFT_10279 [Calcarisporiella thermophila]|uniref:uncharacterized protein n=1 Tax=Calcarisporiella thermophila TaxID=911321 RepID=UPI00374477B7